ncbi:hypothetical protein D3C71_1744070 [compost metagenome]
MLSVRSMLALIAPFHTALRFEMALVTEIHQCAQAFVHPENNVTPATAIAAGRAALRYIFLPAKGHKAIAAVAAFYINLSFIYEH